MSENVPAKAAKTDARRVPRRVTAKRLENVAIYYLQRFAASSESLRRVLMRRVHKSVHYHDTDPAEGAAFVEDIITRFQDSGLLDDATYTEGQIKSLFRRGLSRRAITGRLLDKGVDRELVESRLNMFRDEHPDPDLEAAFAFARRRRLGPFRPFDQRLERRQRDLARLARGGFDLETAKRIIDAENINTLEHMLAPEDMATR